MSTTPLFDMSKATPIGETPAAKPLFDMSKAQPVESPSQKELKELDLPGTFKSLSEPPLAGYPVPTPLSPAGLSAAGNVASGIAQGAKAMLPEAGATVEQTAANVTKWAIQKGLAGGGIAGAWYLLHEFLGGAKK